MAAAGQVKVKKDNDVDEYTARHTALLEEAVAARPRGAAGLGGAAVVEQELEADGALV